ncbi:MAG: Rab family GTPase [Asgard group archaeon]|nr:Rab family GTPase [Asgard group archaeon]
MTTLSPKTGFDFLFKTIVVGDGAVGKTAITFQFATNKFKENYKMTIGVEFTIKHVKIRDRKIKCQIWDTGGQERFRKIRPLYYRGALGGLVVFDVTNIQSFNHLDIWFNEVLANCEKIPLILVGNKIDLTDREVSYDQGLEYARQKSEQLGYNIPYFETSAKTGESIKKVFYELIRKMVDNAEKTIKKKNK